MHRALPAKSAISLVLWPGKVFKLYSEKRMWPYQSFLNVTTFYFCSKNIGRDVFDSVTACKFSWKTLILGVCLQALTSISCWGIAEILDKELELICWRANAQSWKTAEHHRPRCHHKILSTCVHVCQYVYWKQLHLVQMFKFTILTENHRWLYCGRVFIFETMKKRSGHINKCHAKFIHMSSPNMWW